MTEILQTTPGPRPGGAADGSERGKLTGAGTWSLSWRGLRTVAALELRQRVRSTRWIVVLVIWMAILAVLTFMVRNAVRGTMLSPTYSPDGGPVPAPPAAEIAAREAVAGRTVFGVIVFLVLSLAGLVAPALSATSVNGDRTAGVLATLQTTLLSPLEIVLGKLTAAWVVALAFLVTASPFLIWGFLDGGTAVSRLLVVWVLIALTLLVVCAIALGWSAIAARTSTSAVLTYLTVAFLAVGLPLLFALTYPMVSQREKVQVRMPVSTSVTDGTTEPTYQCQESTEENDVSHTERTWWILAASPYVVVADAAPRPPLGQSAEDPLTAIRAGVRELRLGPPAKYNYCDRNDQSDQAERERAAQRDALGVTWPYGLAVDLLFGTLFTVVAVRRLRTPTRTLPRGTRVA